jgi:Flp pilus assembly protein TadD
MAPEQWAGGAVDGRLDQYGLGIVLYEVITGSPPFQGDSMEALYVQHREAPVPPISNSLQVPDEVESIIRKTLEKSPGDRYGSASELADALEGALTGGAAQGPRTEVSPPPRREPPRPAPAAAAPPPRPPQPPAPPRQPAASGTGSGSSGGIPRWLLFGGLGAIVIAAIAIVVAMAIGGSPGSDSVPVAAIAPTDTPATRQQQIEAWREKYLPTQTPTPIFRLDRRPTATPNMLSYYNKGQEYVDAENWVMAVGEYTKAIQLDPENSNIYSRRGGIYRALSQYQNAIDDHTKAIQLDPENLFWYLNRAYTYDDLGQHQNAINDYTKAIQLGPDWALTYISRGSAYNNQTSPQYQLAIADFTQAIQIGSSYDALAYNTRGIAYRDLGQSTPADADKAKACSLDSQYC